MPDFRRITLADKEWIDPLLRMGNLRGSEYTFTNNFIYRTIYHIEVARMNDYYLVRSHREGGAYSYLYPAGSGDLRPAVDALVADAAELGVPFHMNGVPREGTAALEALFPGGLPFRRRATTSTTSTRVKSSSPCRAKSCTANGISSTAFWRRTRAAGPMRRSRPKICPNAGG